MTETILAFWGRLLPHRQEGSSVYPDDTHRVTVQEKDGKPVFVYDALIAGVWHPMGSIELEPQPYFWIRVVEVIRTFTGATFALPDGLVAAAAQGLPGAEGLTQERVREKQVLPRAKPRAGQKLPEFEGTIKSQRRTQTRKGVSNEADPVSDEDVIDNL